MTKTHKFVIRGGTFQNPKRPGKSLWPDQLYLTVSRYDAQRLVEQMQDWLFDADRRDEGEHTTFLVGELRQDV